MSQSLRIIFAGTPDFAARHLDALLSSEHQVVGVFTQPDRPAGRGKKLMPSPVKVLAEAHNLPVFQPSSLRPQDNQRLVADLGADIMVVVAYGLILLSGAGDAPSGLYQRSRLAATALAWRSANSAFTVGGG